MVFINTAIAAKKDIAYKKYVTKNKQIIHTIEINPDKFDIISTHACMLDKSKTQVALMAKFSNAIMGINGGFFRLNQNKKFATPAGVLKIKNKWHGIAYKARGAIGWSNSNNKVGIDIIQTSTKVKIAGKTYNINHFNPLNSYEKNALFSHNSRETINPCNVKIKNNKVSQVYLEPNLINNLTDNEYIFTYNKNFICPFSSKLIEKSAQVKVDIIPLIDRYNKTRWKKYDYIVGGSPILVYKGKKILDFNKEKLSENFINFPHGRTAIGIKRNNNWLFVVVEENILLDIIGFSIPELASFMHQQGCYYAINLDGGSSSSLYIADNIINSFSSLTTSSNSVELNKFQIRPVTDAILVIPKDSIESFHR